MSTRTRPALADLMEQLADSAGQEEPRMRLLLRVADVLAGKKPQQHDDLAAELERWRYEVLDEDCQDHRTDRSLIDALDLAANQLRGGQMRDARWPRAAVQSAARDDGVLDLVADCLDPGFPLEELARRAEEVTQQHFVVQPTGVRRMLLYAPLYLSSHCLSHCVYCGFRSTEKIERTRLSPDEAVRQAEILADRGLRHLLLVAGESPRHTGKEYLADIIGRLGELGLEMAIEVAPQPTVDYADLAAAGVCGVTLYQETYNESLYSLYHPRGKKASYDWRLEGLERAAEAGIRRLGLGVLLGLADPAEDLAAMMRHAGYLQARFPKHTLAFSLPRIHQSPPGFEVPCPVRDELFVRLYCTLRTAFPRAELVLSTRESVELRDRLAKICITQMSAGSRTAPGGYDNDQTPATGQQFPVCDNRSVTEVADWIRQVGMHVTWETRS